MDEDTISDLKQFISASFAQQAAVLKHELKEEFKSEFKEELFDPLQQEMQTGFSEIKQQIKDLSSAVADALEASNNETGERLDEHESRITRLEAKTV